MKLKIQNTHRALGTAAVAVAFGLATVTATMAQDAQPRVRDGANQQQNQKQGTDATTQGNQRTPYQADQAKAGDKGSEFITKAAKCSAMEVKMGRLGIEKAQNPAIKQFAQTLVNDHTKANQQLMQLAARKGVTLPADIQQHLSQTEGAGLASDTTSAVRTERDRTQPRATDTPGAIQDRQPVRDSDKPENRDQNRAIRDEPRAVVGQQHAKAGHDKDHAEAMEAMSKLKSLSGTEFDRAYIDLAVKQHDKAVKGVEEATQTLDDPEVKAFAANMLPTLRQHLQTARSLQSGTQTPQ
jgi:predicted outer membrane protein